MLMIINDLIILLINLLPLFSHLFIHKMNVFACVFLYVGLMIYSTSVNSISFSNNKIKNKLSLNSSFNSFDYENVIDLSQSPASHYQYNITKEIVSEIFQLKESKEEDIGSNKNVKILKEFSKEINSELEILQEIEATNGRSLDQPAEVSMGWKYLFSDASKFNVAKSKEIFQKYAKIGDPSAHSALGLMYASGVGMKRSQAHALIHLTIGAVDNNLAQMALAYRYLTGINVKRSCEKSLDLYRKVAVKTMSQKLTSGYQKVKFIRLFDKQETFYADEDLLDRDLIDYYHLLAVRGDHSAQAQLGILYYHGGQRFKRNVHEAIQYLHAAANANNAAAIAYLGKIYYEGYEGFEQNYYMATDYLKRAADMKNPIGQFYLGMMYLQGNGVTMNTKAGVAHITLAANQGFVDALLQLGIMHLKGVGLPRNFHSALKYFSAASLTDNIISLYHLGLMHDQGYGTISSCETAVLFFKKVAEQGGWSDYLQRAYDEYHNGNKDVSLAQYAIMAEIGYEVAQSNVAFLLEDNDVTLMHVHSSRSYAIKYWSRSAKQGYSFAHVKLGDYHFYGIDTPVDYENSAHHYQLAWNLKQNAQAMYNLGYMHEQGFGTAYDFNLAKRCYNMAAEASDNALIPVAIALIKLDFYNAIATFKSFTYIDIDNSIATLFYNLDIILILIGIFFIYLRAMS